MIFHNFANVYLKGTAFGTSTNENGLFEFTEISSGNYVLLVSSVGYKSYRKRIVFDVGLIHVNNLSLFI